MFNPIGNMFGSANLGQSQAPQLGLGMIINVLMQLLQTVMQQAKQAAVEDALDVFKNQGNNIWKNNPGSNKGLLSKDYLESVANGTAKGNFTSQERDAAAVLLDSGAFGKVETALGRKIGHAGISKEDGLLSMADINAYQEGHRI